MLANATRFWKLGDNSAIASHKASSQTRLLSQIGDCVEKQFRADTFATFLESTQWHERHVALEPEVEPCINESFGIELGPVTYS